GDCSLIITNSDPLLDFPRPTLDKVVNIGGVSVPKPKPLTEEWEEILARRPKTVLVSFGSITQSQWMPEEMKRSLLQVFRRFPDVTFIWKYERPEDKLDEGIDNLVISKWVPQNDLLNHKNLSLFVTHAGMNSILEAANRGIPLLSIPLFGDQMRNAKMIVRAEIGGEADKSLLYDVNGFSEKLRTVLEGEKYSKASKRLSEMMAHRPINLKESLVRNVEFVARFGRLPNMKPASVELNFAQYFLLDIIALGLAVLVLFIVIILVVVRRVLRFALGKVYVKSKAE
uniref:UDP-glucuronosyltransferase n=1 Tax=Steinernema glaseri TaxID=37863 RepID=A0A1I8A5T8_9BILA